MPPPTRVVSINPNNPMPQLIEVFLFNHYCKIPHYLLAGTDINNLDIERPAWLLAVGPEGEIGVHLDGARTRRAVIGLSDFYVQPYDSITQARAAFAERCGGHCGGAAMRDVPPPPSRSPSPVRFTSATGLLPYGFVIPSHSDEYETVPPDDDDDAVSTVSETVEDEYELQVQMGEAKRSWYFCTTPEYLFPTRASADFFIAKWFPTGPRPQLRLSLSPDYAIRKAFGYYLGAQYVLRVATLNEDGKYTYFALNNYEDAKWVLLRLSVEKHCVIQRVPMVELLDLLSPHSARICSEQRSFESVVDTVDAVDAGTGSPTAVDEPVDGDDFEYTQVLSSDAEDVMSAGAGSA